MSHDTLVLSCAQVKGSMFGTGVFIVHSTICDDLKGGSDGHSSDLGGMNELKDTA